MATKILYVGTTLEPSPNWKKGILKDHAPKDVEKQICVVTFTDGIGRVYSWCPLKGQTNEILERAVQIARKMILAEELNFPYITNPEPREDIEELRTFVRNAKEVG